jgi:RNA ligase (TIGR02306 family)
MKKGTLPMTEETFRKLASIRTIDRIMAHPKADLIELAFVGGWQVIVKKGEFKEGDLCVYFEIDSVLPILPEFEFLRKGCYVKKDWLANEQNPTGEGFRLKTIRLRGELSQGLIVPIPESVLAFGNEALDNPEFGGSLQDLDLTNLLSVVKWDPPLPASLGGKAKGYFPSFIPKTDQERVQNLADKVFTPAYQNDFWELTMKLDGSSCTIYCKDGKVGICSRNLELDIDSPENVDNTFIRTVIDSGLYDWMIRRGEGLAIQAELMGPGIQGNREGFKESQLHIFDIYDIEESFYYIGPIRTQLYESMVEGGVNQFRVLHVPVMATMSLRVFSSVQNILDSAEGPSINHPIREGIVFKSIGVPGRSFKAISNAFLEGGGE